MNLIEEIRRNVSRGKNDLHSSYKSFSVGHISETLCTTETVLEKQKRWNERLLR